MTSRPFELGQFLPYRLSYTANLVSDLIAGAYESLFGLTIPEWRVIAHVAENEGISQQEICQRACMDKVSVSRAAIAMTKRGLLIRIDNPDDRRSRRLVLSTTGRVLFAQVAPKALELEQRVFGHIDPNALEAFINMLRSVDATILAEDGGGISGL